jgi:hypothetical protein
MNRVGPAWKERTQHLSRLSQNLNMITGIAHINLIVPPGTLHLAESFYGETLGLHRVAVPARQKDMLAW